MTDCLKTVPSVAQIILMAPYNCYSTKLDDGKSIFPFYADWLINQSGYKTLDQMASVTALLMMSSPIGAQDASDLKAIEQINTYVDKSGRDLETLMRNDSYAMGLIKSELGIGSFKATFAK